MITVYACQVTTSCIDTVLLMQRPVQVQIMVSLCATKVVGELAGEHWGVSQSNFVWSQQQYFTTLICQLIKGAMQRNFSSGLKFMITTSIKVNFFFQNICSTVSTQLSMPGQPGMSRIIPLPHLSVHCQLITALYQVNAQ